MMFMRVSLHFNETYTLKNTWVTLHRVTQVEYDDRSYRVYFHFAERTPWSCALEDIHIMGVAPEEPNSLPLVVEG